MHPTYGGQDMGGLFGAGALVAVMLGMIGMALLINVVICLLLSGCFRRVPKQFRQMEPGMVWLLLIPCFNIVWNFFVFLKLPASYQAYFSSIGRTDVGDSGRGLGLAYAICVAVSLVPCVGYVAAGAALVLLILFLVKAISLKKQIAVT